MKKIALTMLILGVAITCTTLAIWRRAFPTPPIVSIKFTFDSWPESKIQAEPVEYLSQLEGFLLERLQVWEQQESSLAQTRSQLTKMLAGTQRATETGEQYLASMRRVIGTRGTSGLDVVWEGEKRSRQWMEARAKEVLGRVLLQSDEREVYESQMQKLEAQGLVVEEQKSTLRQKLGDVRVNRELARINRITDDTARKWKNEQSLIQQAIGKVSPSTVSISVPQVAAQYPVNAQRLEDEFQRFMSVRSASSDPDEVVAGGKVPPPEHKASLAPRTKEHTLDPEPAKTPASNFNQVPAPPLHTLPDVPALQDPLGKLRREGEYFLGSGADFSAAGAAIVGKRVLFTGAIVKISPFADSDRSTWLESSDHQMRVRVFWRSCPRNLAEEFMLLRSPIGSGYTLRGSVESLNDSTYIMVVESWTSKG